MQDWMKFHPSTFNFSSASPTSSYYLRLCNRVLKIILPSDLREDCGSAERAIQLACILTAYFEDTISETGLFRIFTKRHEELYGKPLPFYYVTEEYYPDEINLNDLYFLAWHALSLWGKEDEIGLFDPFFRDGDHITALREIYDLFDSEFETAPQNEDMQQFLHLPPHANVDEIRSLLDFLSSEYYLGFIEYESFMNTLVEKTEQRVSEAKTEGKDIVEAIRDQEMIFYDAKVNHLFNHYTSLLAQRPSEQLALLVGEEHPLYPLLKSLSTRKLGCFLFIEEKETEFIFEHIHSGTRINVSKEYLTIENEQLTPNRSCLSMSLVKWGDTWQQMGSAILFDHTPGEDSDLPGASLFDNPEERMNLLKEMEKGFLQVNHGKQIAYLKDAEELYDLYSRFLDISLPPTEEKEKTKAKQLAGISPILKKQHGHFTLFFNRVTGIEFYFDEMTTLIADPDNPYYIPGKTYQLELLFFHPNISVEFANYLIENHKVEFIESEQCAPALSVLLDNRDFLLRYYKQESYRQER
jgi:hypothetical protein